MNYPMKTRKPARILSVLTAALLLIVLLAGVPVTLAAGDLSMAPIEDQTLRIIQAKSPTEGVDWGGEPLVLTIRVSDPAAALSVSVDNPAVLVSQGFSGLNGNVLTLKPLKVGHSRVTVTAELAGETVSNTFLAVVNLYEDTGEYEWGEMEIPGGGFMTGYVFNPNVPDRLYCRTDVGGAWRYNFKTEYWENITKWVGANGSGNGGSGSGYNNSCATPLGLAVDPTPGRGDWVYLAGGTTLYRSEDCGETWYVVSSSTGSTMAGNAGGRGTGERIAVVPRVDAAGVPTGDEPIIFLAGSGGGLRRSYDGGATWAGVTLSHGAGYNPTTNETSLAFVNYDPADPRIVIVSTAGQYGGRNASDAASQYVRGPSVFISFDNGATFAELATQPKPGHYPTSGSSAAVGYVGYRSDFTKKDASGNHYMYITFTDSSQTGANFGMEGPGYDGCLFRYKIDSTGAVTAADNITPVNVDGVYVRGPGSNVTANRMMGISMGGVSVDPQIPGALICSSIVSDYTTDDPLMYHRGMEAIFRSLDYGETWFPVLCGYNMFGDCAWGEKAPYIDPTVNVTHMNNLDDLLDTSKPFAQNIATESWWEPWTFLHWDTCPIINPFDSNMAFFNTGAGSYMTKNLTALDDINAAVPHSTPPEGDPYNGFFFQTTGAAPNHVITDRVTNPYTAYRIGNPINNLTAADSIKWETAPGIGLTVNIGPGLISPPSGDIIAMNTLGDHGGWGFKGIHTPPKHSFGYERDIPERFQALYGGKTRAVTNGWITARGLDVAYQNPDVIVMCGAGDWHYLARGGIVISLDNGETFSQMPDGWARGATEPCYTMGIGNGMPNSTVQGYVTTLKNASAGSAPGYCTVSTDGKVVLWNIGGTNQIQRVVRTEDYGQNWTQPVFYSAAAPSTATLSATTAVRLYFDRVNPDICYAFTTSTTAYVSVDGAKTFRPVSGGAITGTFSGNSLTTVSSDYPEVRGEIGSEGVVYVITNNNMYKVVYDKAANTMSSAAVSKGASPSPVITNILKGGQGIGPDGDLAHQAIYVYGYIPAVRGNQQSGYGVYRSLDNGATWRKISNSTDNPNPAGSRADPYLNANDQFADVRALTGDNRTFGRVYLLTGNAPGGANYGEMIVNLVESGEVNKSALNKAIEDFEGLTESHWMTSLWANASAAYEVALEVYDNSLAIQDEVDAAEAALRLALDALLPPWIAPASGQAPSFVIRKNMILQIKIATNVNAANITFTSSNSNIVIVSPTGVITGKSIGVAVIQVKDAVTGAIFNFVVNCTN